MVLGKLDIHMQKNGVGPLPYSVCKKKKPDSFLCQVGKARPLFLDGKHLHRVLMSHMEETGVLQVCSSFRMRKKKVQTLIIVQVPVSHLGRHCLSVFTL